MPATITIKVNDQSIETTENKALVDLIKELGQAPERVVVERNREALTPGEMRQATLVQGDSLEIVRIVAGG